EIGRRILRFEIAPALKRPARLWDSSLYVRVEIEPATLAMIVANVIDGDDALAHADDALDHPIERPARQHVLHPLRPHARAADRMDELPLLLFGSLDLADLPLGQIFDAVGADAEFDDVNGHRPRLVAPAPAAPDALFGGRVRPNRRARAS